MMMMMMMMTMMTMMMMMNTDEQKEKGTNPCVVNAYILRKSISNASVMGGGERERDCGRGGRGGG